MAAELTIFGVESTYTPTYTCEMPAVTLYTKDAALWDRARKAAGEGGLSEFVARAIEAHLRAGSEHHESALVLARRLVDQLEREQ